MLLYVYFFVENYNIIYYNFFFICFIFKNMFFKIPRNDRLNIYSFLKRLLNESSENLNIVPTNYEFDAKSQTNKGYEWMLFIKTKVTNILALNIFMALIYIFFYLLKGFHIVQIMNYNFLVIFFFALNAIIEQLALFVINLGNCIKKSNQSFNDMWIGLLGSVLAFILMFYFTRSMAGVTLFIYFTYYYIFFRLYSWGKNYDITIVNMNLQMPNEKGEEDNSDNVSDSSFNRIITNENL